MKTMKLSIICLLSAATLGAQTLTIAGPAAAVRPGAAVTLNIGATMPTGSDTGMAALQWLIQLPADYAPIVTPTTQVPKATFCRPDETFCVLIGWVGGVGNATTIPAGPIANYALTVPKTALPGKITFSLTNLVGAGANGQAIALAAGPAYTLTIADPRDLNGDGTVDATDVNLMIAEVLAAIATPGACIDDQNGDGVCNIIDIDAVLLKAMGKVQ
jgi:hypothetical protein